MVNHIVDVMKRKAGLLTFGCRQANYHRGHPLKQSGSI